MRRVMIGLGLMALWVASVSPLEVQGATISGKVVSPKQLASIPSSVLILKCSDRDCLVQEEERFLHLGADGIFKVSDLEPASYMVLAYRRGLTPWLTNVFRLEPGQTAELEIAMSPVSAHPLIRYPEATDRDLQRFNAVLAGMGEPPLCGAEANSSGESYRFLWLRSFHHPILIAVRILDGSASAVFKELDGLEIDEGARLIANETIDVNARLDRTGDDAEGVRFVLGSVADEAEDLFWSLPFDVATTEIRLDGADWTVEGRRSGRCHVVTRWSPDLKSPLRQFVETLIGLSGKRFYYDEYY